MCSHQVMGKSSTKPNKTSLDVKILIFLGQIRSVASTKKFFYFSNRKIGIWRVDQDGSRDPSAIISKALNQWLSSLPLSTAFKEKCLIFPEFKNPSDLEIREITSKGRLIRKRSIKIRHKYSRHKSENRILDIQVGGKRKNKIFLATWNSISFLQYCYKSKKVVSRSTVRRYMVGNIQTSWFNCMSVSQDGDYAFVLQSTTDCKSNVSLHAFKVRWGRLIEKAHVFRFGTKPLKSLGGLICFRWVSKRFLMLFGFTSEINSVTVTFCYDKKENKILVLKHLRKRFTSHYAVSASLVNGRELEESGDWQPVIRILGKNNKVLEVVYR